VNKVIALFFSVIYVVVSLILATLGTVHGSNLFPYFEFGFLAMALGVWWWLCFFIPPHKPKRSLAILTLCGIGLGVLLVLGSSAIQKPLINWDFHQMQKYAAATDVSGMRDDVLLLKESIPIGIRLNYSIRFPDSNYYWQSPFLSPETDLGYTVGWNIVQETIEPPMQVVTAGGDVVPIETAHLVPATRRYEKGQTYNFTVELVPDFLALSTDRSSVCIVRGQTQQKLLADEQDSFYRVTVSGTQFTGRTQKAYRLKNFYDSAVEHGAPDCKYRDGRISFK
jgi:hypothetical protein